MKIMLDKVIYYYTYFRDAKESIPMNELETSTEAGKRESKFFWYYMTTTFTSISTSTSTSLSITCKGKQKILNLYFYCPLRP